MLGTIGLCLALYKIGSALYKIRLVLYKMGALNKIGSRTAHDASFLNMMRARCVIPEHDEGKTCCS